MDYENPFRIISLILLGVGIIQVIAALPVQFFWWVAGDWRGFIPQIAVTAFWLSCRPRMLSGIGKKSAVDYACEILVKCNPDNVNDICKAKRIPNW